MQKKDHIYFIGAGGIGMSALERYFLANGWKVAGYDRTPTELTDELQTEGVQISFADSIDAIPADFRDPATTVVVYTPAVPADHPTRKFFEGHREDGESSPHHESGFEVMKRAAALGLVTRQKKAICFAGTHGKTTTSSMAAWMMSNTSLGCSAFLGGILRNVDSNMILDRDSDYAVCEADEFDRSFLQLTPYIAVITSADADHLDIYGDYDSYLEAFAQYTERIVPGGALLIHTGLRVQPRVPEGVKTFTYSLAEGDYHAAEVTHAGGKITFDFHGPGIDILGVSLNSAMEINAENAVAALASLHLAGALDTPANVDAALRALDTFLGSKRRFEFYLDEPMPGGHVIIDDYAHHPDELKASIRSVKAIYPDSKVTVAFQPHLYTRTRDFAPQFAEALSMADAVILTDLYPAREEPIPGISSQIILDRIDCSDKLLIDKADLIDTVKSRGFEVLLMAGAGDINLTLPEITNYFKAKQS